MICRGKQLCEKPLFGKVTQLMQWHSGPVVLNVQSCCQRRRIF